MRSSKVQRDAQSRATSRWHVRPALVVALVVSLALHAVLSLWPVEFDVVPPPEPLSVTLETMPAPPPLAPPPATAPTTTSTPPPIPPPKRVVRAPRRVEPSPVITEATPEVETPSSAPVANASPAPVETRATPPEPSVVIGPPGDDAKPPVVLPPRLDLAYKVFYGTQGFMIGAATYRFEHPGYDYLISTVAEPRGLA
ncbi:MAG TPA: hypothetical protein VGL43_07310, partial [Casimicrobiaceae bacterium]